MSPWWRLQGQRLVKHLGCKDRSVLIVGSSPSVTSQCIGQHDLVFGVHGSCQAAFDLFGRECEILFADEAIFNVDFASNPDRHSIHSTGAMKRNAGKKLVVVGSNSVKADMNIESAAPNTSSLRVSRGLRRHIIWAVTRTALLDSPNYESMVGTGVFAALAAVYGGARLVTLVGLNLTTSEVKFGAPEHYQTRVRQLPDSSRRDISKVPRNHSAADALALSATAFVHPGKVVSNSVEINPLLANWELGIK